MEQKQTFHYFRPGDLTGLEQYLNAMSRTGWQCVRPGRLRQEFVREQGAFVHRFDYSDAPAGSADAITRDAALERAGWTVAARKKGWLLCRRPEPEAEEDAELPGHREGVAKLFRRRIARLESLRRVLLILGAALMIVGYMSDLLPLLYSCVIPLVIVIPITYLIKFLNEGAES